MVLRHKITMCSKQVAVKCNEVFLGDHAVSALMMLAETVIETLNYNAMLTWLTDKKTSLLSVTVKAYNIRFLLH
jgi:hypothetical protein